MNLTWTKNAPTKPGFYFTLRRGEGYRGADVVDVVAVYFQGADIGQPDEDGGLWYSGANYHGGKVDEERTRAIGLEWSGPLEPPA